MRHAWFLSTVAATAVGALLAPRAGAQGPEVIYTEIPSSPTSVVPGAVDLGGSPVVTNWKSLEDFTLSHDGSQWMLKGRTQQSSDELGILVLGGGTTGTAFAQEGQPFLGGVGGEVYDFFDSKSPASFDTAGDLGFSARARGGVPGTLEKVVVYDATLDVHTIVIQQGDFLTGLSDLAPNPSGDETLGNSVGSVRLLDSGAIWYGVTPIGNCSPSRYPALIENAAGFRQSGVSAVTTFNGPDLYTNVDFDDSGRTPDGLSWFVEADAAGEPPDSNHILAINDVVVLQESFPIGGTGPVFDDVFQTQMVSNGDWIARGDDDTLPDSNRWVVHNGDLVLQTGDAVGMDQVGISISAAACNRVGDWVATCATTGPDATNDVMLLNGEVVLREGDPVDVDGNGLFDDDAFLGRGPNTLATFAGNDLALTDDLVVYFIAYLRDGNGDDLDSSPSFGTPDAFLRMQLTGRTFCDDSDGALASCPCAAGAPDSGCDLPQATGGVGLTLVRQEVAPQNRVTLMGSGYPAMGTPGTVVIRASSLDAGAPLAFGDGLRCISVPLVRLGATLASGGTSVHTFGHGAMAGVGDFFYQVWFRSTPISFCDPTAAFNLSNGRVLTW